MKRLYLRIYLAVLASIALSVVLAGLAALIFGDANRFVPRDEFFGEAAQAMVSAPQAGTDLTQRLEHWRKLSGYDLALFDASGKLLAQAGDHAARTAEEARGRWRRPVGQHMADLPDGRLLVARLPNAPGRGWRGLGFLGALALVGVAVAISAWPLVRRLTRDLERLEASVAAFGAGDFSARARVGGKDEVARLAQTFNDSAGRIETLMNANRTLLANASHELRSPLARLRMGVEALGPDVEPKLKNEIARNVRELDQLIDEILLASRLDARGLGSLQREDLDLRAIGAEECARTGAEFHAGEGSAALFSGDARLLRRLMRNLLENAQRYGAGSHVEAALYGAPSGMLRFDVCDRGPGVPPAERSRIFEPFYRPAGASEASGGVGLGLALVRQIAEAHGGRAECLEREGGGACFRVDLPLAGATRPA